MESSKSIVGFIERVELYLAPSSTAMGSTLERIVTRNTDETRFFTQKSTVFRIFLPFSLVVPGQSTVHLVELDEHYLAPSTRLAGSVCGRIVSQNTPICSLTYPTCRLIGSERSGPRAIFDEPILTVDENQRKSIFREHLNAIEKERKNFIFHIYIQWRSFSRIRRDICVCIYIKRERDRLHSQWMPTSDRLTSTQTKTEKSTQIHLEWGVKERI